MNDTVFFPFNGDLVNIAYVVAIEADEYTDREGNVFRSRITLHNGNYYRSKFTPDETFREISVKTSFTSAAGPPAKESYSKQASERRRL